MAETDGPLYYDLSLHYKYNCFADHMDKKSGCIIHGLVSCKIIDPKSVLEVVVAE